MSIPPLLCVTVTGQTSADLRRARDRATDADLVELRLDTASDPDVAAVLQDRQRPVIVTCRPTWEGGHFQGSEEERRAILGKAFDLGAEYVDIEWRANFDDLVRTFSSRVVLSSHDFAGMPDDLVERYRVMRASGAGVVKIAVQPQCLSDCLPLMALASRAATDDGSGRHVLIAMGEAGLTTRVLAGRLRSAWTYAGGVASVGQVTAARLLREFRFRDVDASTAVYGLLGRPIAHSVSPAMHNAAFRALGLNAVYVPLPAADVDDFLTFADAIGLQGASVTIPYKVPLMACAAEQDDTVRRVGALNTLRRSGSGWSARNTDVVGFLRPIIERGIHLDGARVSVLGAGGSARAAAMALTSMGACVTIHARDARKTSVVAAETGAAIGAWPPETGTWDLLVNCTPVGMHPLTDQTPVTMGVQPPGIVYDLIYNPPVTRLLQEAAAAGHRTIGGLDMLVAQAQEQFEWWTGQRPPAGVMEAAARERLAEFNDNENHLV